MGAKPTMKTRDKARGKPRCEIRNVLMCMKVTKHERQQLRDEAAKRGISMTQYITGLCCPQK